MMLILGSKFKLRSTYDVSSNPLEYDLHSTKEAFVIVLAQSHNVLAGE